MLIQANLNIIKNGISFPASGCFSLFWTGADGFVAVNLPWKLGKGVGPHEKSAVLHSQEKHYLMSSQFHRTHCEKQTCLRGDNITCQCSVTVHIHTCIHTQRGLFTLSCWNVHGWETVRTLCWSCAVSSHSLKRPCDVSPMLFKVSLINN